MSFLLTKAIPLLRSSKRKLKLDLRLQTSINAVRGSCVYTRSSTARYLDGSDILQTAAIDAPVFRNNGLVIEPGITNAFTYSNDMTQAVWTKTNLTVSANATTDPTGGSTATLLAATTTNGVHLAQHNCTLNSVTCSYSVYAKAGGYNWIALAENHTTSSRSFFNLSNGTIGTVDADHTASIVALPNGWYRCTIQFLGNTNGTWKAVYVCSADNTISFAGDGTSGVYVYEHQVERLPFATSPITCAGSATTRSSPSAVCATSGLTPTTTTISVTFRFDALSQGTRYIWGSYTDANNSLQLFHDGTNLVFRKRVAGTSYDATKALAYVVGTFYTAVCRLQGGQVDIFCQGAKGAGNSNTTPAVVGTLKLGEDGNGANQFFGAIKTVEGYRVALNDDLCTTKAA